ncbi:FBD-associated F-box protein At5g38590-like [Vigna radiata var. radiata]|uniref:FBD-associated F-box protein At5g38590-like n=1 Tax=Vigna radiata var. radiata TaxID=3916 RepID=A0A1S3U033_VIGRR|nr:FBD-associated F-box protein At5g38590-like [Vigna radiata var. radiata]
MADLISSLSDDIICYILYFLPSQQVVATSVLSKRWNLLWRSVFSLDFNADNEDFWGLSYQKTFITFYSSVCSFLVGRGDQPFYRISLIGYSSIDGIIESIKTQIRTAVSGSDRVQILDMNCGYEIVIPSAVFSFKSLVTLKLKYITVEDISLVDLPSLKILHLKNIKVNLSQLLSGCPNLEDLKVKHLTCETTGKFIGLPKLVRVRIDELFLPLEIFKDVEVFKVDWIFQPNNFDFQNLVQLKLIVGLDWLLLLEVLNHCPKLQSLVICIFKNDVRYFQTLNFPGYEEDVWPYPQTVPACISSHLKTIRLTRYSGSKDEFHFARYILENAKYLQTMEICFDDGYDLMETMERELSSFRYLPRFVFI